METSKFSDMAQKIREIREEVSKNNPQNFLVELKEDMGTGEVTFVQTDPDGVAREMNFNQKLALALVGEQEYVKNPHKVVRLTNLTIEQIGELNNEDLTPEEKFIKAARIQFGEEKVDQAIEMVHNSI